MGVIEAVQVGVAAALLADPDCSAAVANTSVGPAVFASRQPFPDAYPRYGVGVPQVGPANGCQDGWEAIVTVDCYAQGPEATLTAGRLADLAIACLDCRIDLEGFRVRSGRTKGDLTASGANFQTARPVGDPDPTIEHVAVVFRYLISPA